MHYCVSNKRPFREERLLEGAFIKKILKQGAFIRGGALRYKGFA